MLKTRVITALVLLVIFLPILFLTPPIFLYLLLSSFISLAAWEWGRLIWGKHSKNSYIYAILVQCILLVFCINLSYFSMELHSELIKYCIFSLWICSFFWVFIVPMIMRRQLTFPLHQYEVGFAIIGLIIFIADWYAIVILRNQGLWVFLSVLMIVWAADIGAYFFGKKFGKHKLALQLSPGKSIEGALGGMFCVCLLALVFYQFGPEGNNFFSILAKNQSVTILIFATLFLTIMSITGDLFESQLKRLAGFKDSSGLLPGHGGVLDRLDALLPVLPIAALILMSVT